MIALVRAHVLRNGWSRNEPAMQFARSQKYEVLLELGFDQDTWEEEGGGKAKRMRKPGGTGREE